MRLHLRWELYQCVSYFHSTPIGMCEGMAKGSFCNTLKLYFTVKRKF